MFFNRFRELAHKRKLEKRERSTIEHYRNHVDHHIKPRLGRKKLAKLTTPRIQAFRDDLLANLLRVQANIVTRILWLTQVAAGVVNAKGEAKYALRHFYMSWLINRKKDGGLELPIKTEQQRLGHSSIVMTLHVYGHLFPRGDDGSEMAEVERLIMA